MRGRAQRFGNDINTDYIIAAHRKAETLELSEMAKYTFEDIDPDFVNRVKRGDIIVAGRNFGCGSSRETAVHVLKECGIAAVLAPSFARIFFRNAINNGLLAAECDTTGIEQGDEVEVYADEGVVHAPTRGIDRPVTRLPSVMQELLNAGGIVPYLQLHGDLAVPDQSTTNH